MDNSVPRVASGAAVTTLLARGARAFARVGEAVHYPAMRRLGSALLALEFAAISSFYLFVFVFVDRGGDARIYQAATRAWLSGTDPWLAGEGGIVFAGPPLTLLPLAPFAWLPPEMFAAIVIGASVVAAIVMLRALKLPAWWLFFPPLVEGVSVGNPDVLVAMLLVLGRFEWLAVLLKVYAVVPLVLLRRSKPLIIAALIVIVTAPILPWGYFFAHDVPAILSSQTGRGVPLWLAPIALVGLALVGRDRAWWAVPAAWPSAQLHYSILALPALTTLTAAIVAIPIAGTPVIALLVAVITMRAGRLRANPVSR